MKTATARTAIFEGKIGQIGNRSSFSTISIKLAECCQLQRPFVAKYICAEHVLLRKRLILQTDPGICTISHALRDSSHCPFTAENFNYE